jgi:hypothetical protein
VKTTIILIRDGQEFFLLRSLLIFVMVKILNNTSNLIDIRSIPKFIEFVGKTINNWMIKREAIYGILLIFILFLDTNGNFL